MSVTDSILRTVFSIADRRSSEMTEDFNGSIFGGLSHCDPLGLLLRDIWAVSLISLECRRTDTKRTLKSDNKFLSGFGG